MMQHRKSPGKVSTTVSPQSRQFGSNRNKTQGGYGFALLLGLVLIAVFALTGDQSDAVVSSSAVVVSEKNAKPKLSNAELAAKIRQERLAEERRNEYEQSRIDAAQKAAAIAEAGDQSSYEEKVQYNSEDGDDANENESEENEPDADDDDKESSEETEEENRDREGEEDESEEEVKEDDEEEEDDGEKLTPGEDAAAPADDDDAVGQKVVKEKKDGDDDDDDGDDDEVQKVAEPGNTEILGENKQQDDDDEEDGASPVEE